VTGFGLAPRHRWRQLAAAAGTLLVLGGGAGSRAAGDPFVQEAKGVVVDWRHGTVSARGVAAGDWRTPSAEMARAGAERRARNEGRSRLVEALRVLPLGGGRHLDAAAISRAVDHARTVHVDYQSNGGVVLQVEVAFGDWEESLATKTTADAPAAAALPLAAPLALRLTEGSLAAAPALLVGTREIALASVSYAPSGDLAADVRPLVVRADKKGRLVADEKLNPEELAHRHAVIYVQKLLR
jgi:hypothetical protein